MGGAPSTAVRREPYHNSYRFLFAFIVPCFIVCLLQSNCLVAIPFSVVVIMVSFQSERISHIAYLWQMCSGKVSSAHRTNEGTMTRKFEGTRGLKRLSNGCGRPFHIREVRHYLDLF